MQVEGGVTINTGGKQLVESERPATASSGKDGCSNEKEPTNVCNQSVFPISSLGILALPFWHRRHATAKAISAMFGSDKLGLISTAHGHSAMVSSDKQSTEADKNGKAGSDGENGRYGNPGGHIMFLAETLDHNGFNLSANGSRGEDGQNGGKGGDGWSPSRAGTDGSEPKFTELGDQVIINYGTYGQDGGQGGDGGMGGAPGKSGISGKVELINLESDEKSCVSQVPIDDGEPGLPGEPRQRRKTHPTWKGLWCFCKRS